MGTDLQSNSTLNVVAPLLQLLAKYAMRDPPLEPTQNVSQNVSQNVEDATFEIRIELKRAFSKSESFVAWRLATPANAGMAISAKEHGRPARAHIRALLLLVL